MEKGGISIGNEKSRDVKLQCVKVGIGNERMCCTQLRYE